MAELAPQAPLKQFQSHSVASSAGVLLGLDIFIVLILFLKKMLLLTIKYNLLYIRVLVTKKKGY